MKKILVVDSERHVVLLIRMNLERYGYEVIEAFDGKEALMKVKAKRPDLIVTEIVLPKMDGWELLTRLRKDDEAHEIAIIFLTQLQDDASQFRAMREGVDWYLMKPYNPMDLVTSINRLLDSK